MGEQRRGCNGDDSDVFEGVGGREAGTFSVSFFQGLSFLHLI